ncbi:hypothetical protein [Deinococcus cellulosilyticus]|uniref:HEAT repeat domain-containing protein n=1 Tax=Deinococcus cellulosilyticus (strain DSM 18568 / NBRC 106333 / KACC 11606 / 5516J-15) TaxID=1223518 RepID=A0A511N424_DEIC1|nr:hypothetical protein [Deinococcus cellulosilyticus]GEM47166.1 hypothetical protein DC3_28010 [Deinococcus cellulosilyticus NBRC 106333 = KACC 11606]
MTLKPPSFAVALKRGLGRALVHLEHHQDESTRKVVWDALLHCQRHDPQVEGLGIWYLLEAARRTGILQELAPRLIQLLDEEDSWDTIQHVLLLGALGGAGDPLAVKRLREHFVVCLQGQGQLLNWLIQALVEAQGEEGLRFALSKLGWAHQQGLKAAQNAFSLNEAAFLMDCDMQPVIEAWAREDPLIQQFLNDCLLAKTVHKPIGALDTSYENISKRLEDTRAGLMQLARHATEQTLRRLAEDLLQETDARRLERYLLLFQRQPFPMGPLPLLPLARHDDPEVRYRAQRGLKHFQSSEVRKLALELLQDPQNASVGMELLTLNFQSGDERMFRDVLNQLVLQEDEDHLWSFLFELRQVAHQHPTPALLDLMAQGFEHLPCSHCRHQMVLLLKAHQKLPQWLEEEARLDLNEDLREEFL